MDCGIQREGTDTLLSHLPVYVVKKWKIMGPIQVRGNVTFDSIFVTPGFTRNSHQKVSSVEEVNHNLNGQKMRVEGSPVIAACLICSLPGFTKVVVEQRLNLIYGAKLEHPRIRRSQLCDETSYITHDVRHSSIHIGFKYSSHQKQPAWENNGASAPQTQILWIMTHLRQQKDNMNASSSYEISM
jgi:hypothetical protein